MSRSALVAAARREIAASVDKLTWRAAYAQMQELYVRVAG